ncbi:MAG: AAA family ATPase [Deltaproteobacteria bacterium]|nr:AAA family ATPase [Deltaproteobacteria bacterium]
MANITDGSEPQPSNVVLLIDEYDFPLLDSVDDPTKDEELRIILRNFYSTIKAFRNMLRFTFITGITKFSGLSIFSGMNNAEDISLDPHFSTICGFTDDEVKNNFYPHILSALAEMQKTGYLNSGSTAVNFMDLLEYWYDGYSWDGIKKVYNPYSIIKYLKHKTFNHYWYNSGTSIASYKFKHKPDTFIDLISNNLRTSNLEEIDGFNDTNVESFLFQTGYVTIDSIQRTKNIETYKLKCPNNEIAYAISKDFVKLNSPFPGLDGSINQKFSGFVDAFDASDSDECSRIFTSFLDQSVQFLHRPDEYTYQVLLFFLLNSKGWRARLEQYVGSGRADIVYLSPSQFNEVVEIKYHRPSKNDPVQKILAPPASGHTVQVFSELPEHVKDSLERGVADASRQIFTRNYLRAFYLEGETRACAVAIHGPNNCLFRFYNVDCNAKTVTELVNSEQPEYTVPGFADSDTAPEQK